MTVLVEPTQLWACPRCTFEDVTHEAQPHTRMHACKGMNGLTIPMVPAGTTAKITTVEREDYVGDETVTTVDGRPIMAVITEREDGSNDTTVYAPVATARAEER